jgi:hypothetical protein
MDGREENHVLRWRLVVLASTAVLGAAVLPSCGGDAVPPDEYASELCGALGNWVTTLQEDAQGLASVGASPEQGKEAITNFLDNTIENTDEAIGEIEDIGVPDVENGEEVHNAIVDALEQAQSTFEDALSEAEDLPTDSQQAFRAAAQEIGTSISGAQGEIQSTLTEVEPAEELDEAFNDEESCQQMQF